MRHHVILVGHRGPRQAFTLVELLVVIAIIGLLMALLLPAVQSVREGARRSHCANNVAQLTKAALAHETVHGFYPSGGWGYWWVGDADRGFGRGQPGGWLYSCLPYLEQTAVWSLPTDGDPINIGTTQLTGGNALARTLLPTVNCPTRRASQLLPVVMLSSGVYVPNDFVAGNASKNTSDSTALARADYAVNAGTMISGSYQQNYYYAPATNRIEQYAVSGGSVSMTYYDFPGYIGTSTQTAYSGTIPFPGANVTLDGIAFNLSEVRATDVTDGASMTYLLGEHTCDPDQYYTGVSGCDNESWVQGSNNDMLRSGLYPPQQDTRGVSPCGGYLFGSAHAISFCMAFADGSTRWIRYDIDPKAHFGLSDRMENHRDMPVIPGNVLR